MSLVDYLPGFDAARSRNPMLHPLFDAGVQVWSPGFYEYTRVGLHRALNEPFRSFNEKDKSVLLTSISTIRGGVAGVIGLTVANKLTHNGGIDTLATAAAMYASAALEQLIVKRPRR